MTKHSPTSKWGFCFLLENIVIEKTKSEIFCFCGEMTNTKWLKGKQILGRIGSGKEGIRDWWDNFCGVVEKEWGRKF